VTQGMHCIVLRMSTLNPGQASGHNQRQGMNGAQTNEQFEAALAEVWARTYPVIVERINAIEVIVSDCAELAPSARQIAQGREGAHKLAGVLGTFGLDRGSQLARELEDHFEGFWVDTDTDAVATLVAEPRSVVEGGATRPGIQRQPDPRLSNPQLSLAPVTRTTLALHVLGR
jgi:HPt (histidine-containing phosphotransfer) domain-containing protein